MKKLTIRLDPTTHKKFRLYCVERNASAQELIEQYILSLIKDSTKVKEAK